MNIPGIVYSSISESPNSVNCYGHLDLREDNKRLIAPEDMGDEILLSGKTMGDLMKKIASILQNNEAVSYKVKRNIKEAVEIEQQCTAPKRIFDERDTFTVSYYEMTSCTCLHASGKRTGMSSLNKKLSFGCYCGVGEVGSNIEELWRKKMEGIDLGNFSIEIEKVTYGFTVIDTGGEEHYFPEQTYMDLENSMSFRSILKDSIVSVIPLLESKV